MKTKEITDCETIVMKCIWDSTQDLSIPEITDIVNTRFGKNWHTQTISTFLARLVKKDYLRMYRKENYSYYHPLVKKEDYQKDERKRNVLKQCVQYWHGGDMSVFIRALMDKSMLSQFESEKSKKKIDE